MSYKFRTWCEKNKYESNVGRSMNFPMKTAKSHKMMENRNIFQRLVSNIQVKSREFLTLNTGKK